MFNEVILAAFADELEKLALSPTTVAAGLGAAGGIAAASAGRNAVRDYQEGNILRKTREFEKQRRMYELMASMPPGAGYV
jgi:glycerate kinase